MTFFFNGGPGSASFWTQMGGFGPKIVRVDSPAQRGRGIGPGSPLVDNPDALLDVTDLVFIDPVGTGYSRALGGAKPDDFQKTSTDAASVADFINAWLSENGRWNSPRFIGGESYGSIRTAMIVDRDTWMTFNGAILVSQGLDWGTVIMPPGYDLGYQQFLPSYAAAAWFHGKTGRDVSIGSFVDRASRFASTDYVAALAQGPALDAAEKERVANGLAALTAIPADAWMKNDLRIPPDEFRRMLLADRGLRLGRFDARYVTAATQAFDPAERYDPSLSTVALPYLEAMRAYLARDLNVSRAGTYIGTTDARWVYDLDNKAFLNPAPHIGNAMRKNDGMRLFVASGYYDFSSPVYSAFYNIGHAGIPMSHVTMKYYETGHMMYVDDSRRHDLMSDIRAFLKLTLSSQGR